MGLLPCFADGPDPNQKQKAPQTVELHYYISNDKLPLELIFLIDSIQRLSAKSWDKIQFRDFSQTILKLDLAFSKMQHLDMFFLAKTEIYKSILHFNQSIKSIHSIPTPKQFEINRKLLSSKLKNLPAFVFWLVMATQRDIKLLIGSTSYNDLMEHLKRKRRLKDRRLKSLHHKFNYLLPLYEKIITLTEEELGQDLLPLMNSTLKKLAHFGTIFVRYGHYQTKTKTKAKGKGKTKDEDKLQFFTIANQLSNNETLQSRVDEIIDNLINKIANQTGPALPPQWAPQADTIGLTKPNPHYLPPQKLPRPVTDWDPINPKPEPDYLAPAVLPDPVYDWLADQYEPNDHYQAPKTLPKPTDDWHQHRLLDNPEQLDKGKNVDPAADWIMN
ncbi:MAG: hypothetical protein ISR65_03750 [Bacteriovoracaceae bacterium]|nr:hypothetical protein [Bacteriovoracaceae bacterium]